MLLTEINKLKNISRISRIYSLLSIYFAGSGHPGGSLSAIEIIVYLYVKKIKIKSLKDLKIKNRDRFILSKGHAVPALYSIISVLGFIKLKEILKLRKINSVFQGHPCRIETPWVECSTGSLAQGFSFGVGQALALKKLKIDKKIFILIGDGEMQEGQIWEGLMFSAQMNLKNLVVILDYNKIQSDNFVKNIINIEPIKSKVKSFNWNIQEINGHSFGEIDNAINKKFKNNKPTFIIANTIKGKGVSYMENNVHWHGSVKMTNDQILSSLKELRANEKYLRLCKKHE